LRNRAPKQDSCGTDDLTAPHSAPCDIKNAEVSHGSNEIEVADFAAEAPQTGVCPDPVEVALFDALTKATAAGQWDVVGQLARELEARRKARSGVVVLDVERKKRKR
jgi:hypothetical protein